MPQGFFLEVYYTFYKIPEARIGDVVLGLLCLALLVMLIFMKTSLGPDDAPYSSTSRAARKLVWAVATSQYLCGCVCVCVSGYMSHTCILRVSKCINLNFTDCQSALYFRSTFLNSSSFLQFPHFFSVLVSAERSGGRGCILGSIFLGCLRSSRVYHHWGNFQGAPAVQAPTHLRHHSQRHRRLLWGDCRGEEQTDEGATRQRFFLLNVGGAALTSPNLSSLKEEQLIVSPLLCVFCAGLWRRACCDSLHGSVGERCYS